MNNGDETIAPPPIEKDKTGVLKFTKKDILKMPTKFRKFFIVNDCLVRVRRRKRSKLGYDYEARYRRGEFNISVSSKDYELLKPKFIEALNASAVKNKHSNVPTNFDEFANYYFETFWRRKVAASTYKTEINRYKNHIRPILGGLALKNITPEICQNLLDGILANGYGKTADEVYGKLNQIFDCAINHNLIKHNPLSVIVFQSHEREHGKALTKDDERLLLKITAGTPLQIMFAVIIYTGLRPNEYNTARIEGKFIVAVNSKRKTKKIEYKKIPISPMLRPYLNGVDTLRFYNVQRMRDELHSVLGDFTLKDLRTTFNTRCVECGINDIARKRFMGHSLGALGNAYTDLSDEFLIAEGEKLNY